MDFADLMALDLIDMAEKSLQKIEKAVGNRPAEVAVNPQDITDMKEAMINLTLLLTQLDKKVEDLTEMVKSNHKAVAYEKSIPDTIDLPLLRDRLEELAQINKKDKDKPKNREDEDLIIPAASKPTVNVVQRDGYVEDVYTLDEATRLHIVRNTLPYNDDDLRFYKDKNDNILCSNNLINLNDGDLVRTGVLKGYDEEDAEGDVLEYKQRINLSYKLNPEDIVMAIAYLQPKKRITYISSILSTNDTTWINNKRKELTEDLMELEEEDEEEEDDEYKGFDVYFYQSMDDYIMCCYTDNPPSCVILTDLMVDKEFDAQGWYKCLTPQEDRYIYVYQIATASPQFSTDRSVRIPLSLSDPKKQDILKNGYPGTARAVKGITKSWLKRTRGTKSIKKFKRDELWN